jgi:hypothetical protein
VYAIADQAGGPGTGAVYVYDEPGGGWTSMTQTAVLTPSTATDFLGLGERSMAASGSSVFVGAQSYGTNSAPEEGAVMVFTEAPGGWVNSQHESALLTPSDGGLDLLGSSVAVSGQTVVAGAPFAGATQAGAVYLFQENGSAWTSETQQAILNAPAGAGSTAGQLGDSVAIDGSTVVAGAPAEGSGSAFAMGEVYVYTKPATGWVTAAPTAELTPPSATQFEWFGMYLTVGDFPSSAADSGPPAGQPTVETIFVGTGSGTGVYRFAEPTSGWKNATDAAALGLQSASAFSLAPGRRLPARGCGQQRLQQWPGRHGQARPGQRVRRSACERDLCVMRAELGGSGDVDVVHGDGDRRAGRYAVGADRFGDVLVV